LNALDFIAAGGIFLPANLFLSVGVDPTSVPSSTVHGNDGGIEDDRIFEEANGIDLVEAATSLGRTEFTDREATVLECLCRGKPNKLIAHELGLSESTVKMYLGRLMRKVKMTNRTELALFGERLLKEGLLSGVEVVPDKPGLSESQMPSDEMSTALAGRTPIRREPQKAATSNDRSMARERVGSRFSSPPMAPKTSHNVATDRLREDARLGTRSFNG
jgi:DNA-binding CsgD family transcriptional regulator